MKRFIELLLVLVVSAGALWAGGQRDEPATESSTSFRADAHTDGEKPPWLYEETPESITIVDAAGNTIEIAKPVERVVANGMGELFATLRALDANELILASTEYVTRNSGFFPSLSALPSISTVDQVNQEMIIELNPDVIFSTTNFYSMLSPTVTELFPVVQVDFETIEEIEMVGAILGRESEAGEYVDWIERYTDVIDERVAGLDEAEYRRLFIFYGGEWGMTPPPPYGTFGRDNPRNDLVRRAGGISISENLEGEWITVDAEWVVEQDPPMIVRECYVTSDRPEMGYNVSGTERSARLMDAVVNQAALSMTKAVQNDRVLMIYGDLFEDSWFLATAYLAKYFHPDLFADFDPVAMHREFLNRFQGLDFDIDDRGVFVYSLE